MNIYFVAHGTTTDNEAEIASGWKDVGLSKLGEDQARQVVEHVNSLKFDFICCSDLKRATDTVKLAFGSKYPVITDNRLRELNYGDFNGKPNSEVGWRKSKYITESFPNGESYEQAMVRLHSFYNELKQKYPNKNVLVVGHRATQFGLDTLILGKTLDECLAAPFRWQPYWEYHL